jgi:hypothetical protein
VRATEKNIFLKKKRLSWIKISVLFKKAQKPISFGASPARSPSSNWTACPLKNKYMINRRAPPPKIIAKIFKNIALAPPNSNYQNKAKIDNLVPTTNKISLKKYKKI